MSRHIKCQNKGNLPQYDFQDILYKIIFVIEFLTKRIAASTYMGINRLWETFPPKNPWFSYRYRWIDFSNKMSPPQIKSFYIGYDGLRR